MIFKRRDNLEKNSRIKKMIDEVAKLKNPLFQGVFIVI